MSKLSVIVPCFNEEAVIEETHRRLSEVLSNIDMDYELIYINDGSRDKTMLLLTSIAELSSLVKVLSFSRNFGHQRAISAGMDYCR